MSVATMSILEREVRAKGGGGGGGMGLSLFPRGILRSGGTSVKFRFTKKPCLLALHPTFWPCTTARFQGTAIPI